MPSVAIVILNWNGKKHLQQFLPSVLACTYANLRIIVADNASTDDSVSYLQQQFPQVQLILLTKNFGFAKGYNDALRQVDADYYVLLNSDVETTPEWLQPIITLLEKDPDYAACQPKILSFSRKTHFEYAGAAGGWLDAFGYPFSRGRIFDFVEKDEHQYDSVEEIFWASGAAMVIKKEAFNDIGGFDEYFFAHQEEIDLCWRLQLKRKKIFCCPTSVVYHLGGGTLGYGNSRKIFLNFRNNHILLAKNLHLSEAWWKIPYRLMLDQLSAFKGLITGNFRYFAAIFKAQLAFFYWMFFVVKKRYTFKKRRTSELTGLFSGNVAFEFFLKERRTFKEIMKAVDK